MILEPDEVVGAYAKAIESCNFGRVVSYTKEVIRKDWWRSRVSTIWAGRTIEFKTFPEFVEAKVPLGLGTDLKTLKRLCGDDREALDLIDEVCRREHGGDRTTKIDNVNLEDIEQPKGNSRDYALRRLRKDRPDLHAQVLRGSLSPHRAAVQAGHRVETFTVPLDPKRAAGTLKRRFRGELFDQLLRELELA